MNIADDLRSWEGLYVGLLRPDELERFDAACADGLAYRSYEGAGGFLGLPKVRRVMVPQTQRVQSSMEGK